MPMSVKHDYHIKYYSGRLNTYKLDWTTITVGVPRMLVMSTSPASAGASCASAAIAPSAARAVGAALLTVKIRQPSHEFTFGVGMSFIPYPLVLTPVVQQVHVCMSVLEFDVYAGI
jgi:hypothetical protein